MAKWGIIFRKPQLPEVIDGAAPLLDIADYKEAAGGRPVGTIELLEHGTLTSGACAAQHQATYDTHLILLPLLLLLLLLLLLTALLRLFSLVLVLIY